MKSAVLGTVLIIMMTAHAAVMTPDQFAGDYTLGSKIEPESICAPFVRIERDMACGGLTYRMGNNSQDLYGFVRLCNINNVSTDFEMGNIAGYVPVPNLHFDQTTLQRNQNDNAEILAKRSTLSYGFYREAKRLILQKDNTRMSYETSSIKHDLDEAKKNPYGSYYEGCHYSRVK